MLVSLQRSERKEKGGDLNLSEEKASSLLTRISELAKKHPTAVVLIVVIAVVVAGLTIYVYARSGKTEEAKKT